MMRMMSMMMMMSKKMMTMMVMPVMITTRSSLSIPAVRVVTNEEARSRLLATAIAQLFEDHHHLHDDHHPPDDHHPDHDDDDVKLKQMFVF